MKTAPGPLQTLIVWRLLSQGGGEFLGDIRPGLKPKDRRALEEAGIIKTERRTRQAPGKRAVSASYVSLTDSGWCWASEHLDAEVSTRSPASGPILRAILTRLKSHLDRREIALADFICERGEDRSRADEQESPQDDEQLVNQVIAACRGFHSGAARCRVRLADLRAAMPGIHRDPFDRTLLELERCGRIVLYPLDDPGEIRPEDDAAALLNSMGHKRHVLYLED